MPVFAEDPGQFSKKRLKSELVSHNVELPSGESKKRVYVELYMKHVGSKSNADFSSDDEDQIQNGDGPTEQGEESDMVDLSSLTDDQLKDKLLEYGIKAGPIVASTRALYEGKLHRLMVRAPVPSVNGTADAGQYSESEEEGHGDEEEDEEESGSELYGTEMASHSEPSAAASTVGTHNRSKEMFYPQCFSPHVRQGSNQQRSSMSSKSNSQPFSISQLIENRLSSRSRPARTEGGCNYTPVASRGQWDLQRLSKNTMTDTLFLAPECLAHQKQATTKQPAAEPVTNVLMELFPDAAVTPTGITATKRRSIKGAAGRPVQFKYPETPASPTTLARREIRQRLVPVWVQVVVFLLVAGLLYLIYVSVENSWESPFSEMLDSLSQEAVSDEDVQLIGPTEMAS